MRRKILGAISGISAIALMLAYVGSVVFFYGVNRANILDTLTEEGNLLALSLEHHTDDIQTQMLTDFHRQTPGVRLTLVAGDGEVLYDSEVPAAQMANHASRPEIVSANKRKAHGLGSDIVVRDSDTLGEDMCYYARAIPSGKIVRVARPVRTFYATALSGLPILGGIALGVFGLSFLIARSQARLIVEPLEQIDLNHPLSGTPYDRDRLPEVSKNGVFGNSSVFGGGGVFGSGAYTDTPAEDETSRSESAEPPLPHAMLQAYGKDHETVPIYPEFLPLLQRLEHQNRDKEAAARSRREFSANVSHELKTPLTSISGYAEIIRNGLVKDEDIPGFAERIHQESSRLLDLIGDIMELSRLDEGGLPSEAGEVELFEVCRTVVERLQPRAAAFDVKLTLSGSHTTLTGVEPLLGEMVYNLVDNAIKYNREGGEVNVWAGTHLGRPQLVVTDTGIGIPYEDQERVFERFYRVDKSHSRQTGGTGLGLSIVKHAAILHSAEITVHSTPGQGTRIEVTFPDAA
ncbi:ATP-binding protein [uncultured Mobiluncus sp.]|uniref:sensor histidine kinase n=1 Tax=uncultured Mobiluncus sp. TaxID=293425 RepID=UPI0025F47067|nr:ATP-binding protein [uncultured Mobiluncus sp.]